MAFDFSPYVDFKTLTGAILGAGLVWLGEYVQARYRKSKNVYYLAVRLIPILDQFLDSCYAAAFDDGTVEGQPAGQNQSFESQTPNPTFTPPDDVDWNSINKKLLHKIMFLSSDLYSANKIIVAESEDYCGDGGEFIAVRQYQYAKVAIKCDDLLKEIRLIITMADREYPEWWNPREKCLDYIKKFEEIQKKKEEANVKTWDKI